MGWKKEWDRIESIIAKALEDAGYDLSISDSGTFAKHPNDNNSFEVIRYPPAWGFDEICGAKDHPDFS